MPSLRDAIGYMRTVARGWPDRLYLVGRDGRIAFQGGEGPFGFKPEELERAIERRVSLAAA